MIKRLTESGVVPNKRKRLEPGDLLKLLRTGDDLLSRGHTQDVIRICKDALKQMPGHADLVYLQFLAHAEDRQYTEALRLLRTWGKHPAGQNIPTQFKIARGYCLAKRFKSAQEHLAVVLAAKPDMVGAKLLMASALADSGHKKRALDALPNESIGPGEKPQNVMALATMLARLGKHQDAKSVLTTLMRTGAMKVECVRDLIRLPAATWSPETCDLVTELLQDPQLSVQHKIMLNSSAGRIADHKGRYSAALQSFTRAKTLSTNAFDFDMFGKAVAACTSEKVAAISCPPAREKKPPAVTPLFIIGLPRSGKTTLETLLAETVGFAACGEIPVRMFVDDRIIIGPQGQLPDNYADRLARIKSTRQQLYARQYIEQICDQFSLPKSTRYVINTMPHNFLNIGGLCKAFPSSKFICVKRNKYDNFTFCFMKIFKNKYDFTRDFSTFMRYYDMFEKVVSHWQSALSANFTAIDYEDMVRSPGDTVNRLLSFLGVDLPADAAVADRTRASGLSDRYIDYWKNYPELFSDPSEPA